MRDKHTLSIAVIAIMLAILLVPGANATPDGAQLDIGTSTTKGFFAAGIIGAQGGNNTNLNASTETQTEAWQGFFGEVAGNITLQDASGFSMYEWPDASAGTIFASRDSNVDFTSIAGQTDCTIDEDLTGTNSDRVNNTFTLNTSLIGWSIAGSSITSACQTHTYVNSSAQNASFEEIILTDDGGTTSVYATKIEQDTLGFDNQTHDYQIIVPDTLNDTTTTYYMYVELQ